MEYTELPIDQETKLKLILENNKYLKSLNLDDDSYEVDISILEYISFQREVYFITNYPLFTMNNIQYSCGTISISKITFQSSFKSFLKGLFNNGKLFCLFCIQENSNGIRVHGASIGNTSHLLIKKIRDEKIDDLLN